MGRWKGGGGGRRERGEGGGGEGGRRGRGEEERRGEGEEERERGGGDEAEERGMIGARVGRWKAEGRVGWRKKHKGGRRTHLHTFKQVSN